MSLLPRLNKEDREFLEPRREEILESGILVIDKPMGISSMDVIRLLKRVVRAKKIGHGGTLDPFATGVLPILINRATSFSNTIMTSSKEYEGSFILGKAYDTQDMTGVPIQEEKALPEGLNFEGLQNLAKKFEGEIEQTPPLYSAIKKDGKPLYKYARAGELVEVKSRKVVVEKFELLSWDGMRRVEFRARVRKGVYLRTLVHDLGQELGIGAVLESLRRTEAGGFTVEEAVQISTLQILSDVRQHLRPITEINQRNHS